MAGGDETGSVKDEFLAESQEIVESLSRDLLVLDQSQKDGTTDPDLINEIFRGVHTLKGISGMFGYHQVGAVAHALEDLLDDLRLGRVSISQEVLDVLFEGVENFQRLLGGMNADEDMPVDLSDYARSIGRVSPAEDEPSATLSAFAIDKALLSVLTEYEEHRLKTNIQQGVPLYRLEVRFSLTSIDTSLDELKKNAKPLAEIITYLPSIGDSAGDDIDLEVLLASRAKIEALRDALSGPEGKLTLVDQEPAEEQASPPTPDQQLPDSHMGEHDAPIPRAAEKAAAEKAAADPNEEGADSLLSLRSVSNTVRVDIRKLDYLMNVVGELAIVKNAVARLTDRIRGSGGSRQHATELHRANRNFERHLEELQDGILDVRMVPLRQVFDKLGRVVRQVAREHEKQIRLVVTGAETEVDKLIVEELSDPLMHIIRNAIDHGIEKPKMRELSGKLAEGTIAINAYQKGNNVLIALEDDGIGLNPDKLLAVAVSRGIATEQIRNELSRDEILSLIFVPGFTTRSAITDLSGRGVGMDVVKTNIARLGGVVNVESEVGAGTKFTITLPITLAIISALLVRSGDRTFAVPLTAVREALILSPWAIRTVEGREVITLRGATLPLCRLKTLFNLSDDPDAVGGRQYVVVTGMGNQRLGIVVDELHGQQDIVIKPLGKSLNSVRGFSGATDLGDQRVALVLDTPGLMEEVLAGTDHALSAGVSR